MCIAAPGKVVEIKGKKALIVYPGNETRQAMVGIDGVKLGDYVLVQMGIIIEKVSKSSALSAEKAWEN